MTNNNPNRHDPDDHSSSSGDTPVFDIHSMLKFTPEDSDREFPEMLLIMVDAGHTEFRFCMDSQAAIRMAYDLQLARSIRDADASAEAEEDSRS